MDIGIYEGDIINIKHILASLSPTDKDQVIETYRKRSEKEAITCPFCFEKLLLRAGEIRDVHFAHGRGQTCQMARSYDSYQTQVSRENEKHSVIKEIIYTDLKGQERFKPDLKVEYGYKEKGHELWKHYPDIYLNKNGREFAISIITNVHEIGDNKVVQLINKRTKYFKEKGLETIWFVEDRELAHDHVRRVIHLWEAEYGLAIKTEEDYKWDELLKDLSEEFPGFNIPGLFGYRAHAPLSLDVRSLYYVHSEGESITISVHRLILDSKKNPYRAFALTKGYKQSISYALIVKDAVLLCDPNQEDRDRLEFANELIHKVDEYNHRLVNHLSEDTVENQELAAVGHTPEREVLSPVEPDIEPMISEVDITENILKLKKYSITEAEAKQFYYYLRLNQSELIDYGLTLKDLYNIVQTSLGRIGDEKIRTWLVKIQGL